MKKVFVTLLCVGAFTIAANAQQTATSEATAKPQMSKEEKAKQKQKQDEEIAAAYKEVGLSEDQIKQIKEVNMEAGKKSNEVRKDASLTEEARAAKLKEISTEKNAKIKGIMGNEKYKQFSEIRKKQKAAAEVKE
jgi:hypothetical protein